MLRDHKARCMGYPGYTQRWLYRATITAGVSFLLDIPCSKRRMILQWETVQYARQINRRWFLWRKNDQRCLRRGLDYGASGDRMHRLCQPHITWQYSRLLSK